jgi:uncharacterized membrane protein YcaP (DUF421 family)
MMDWLQAAFGTKDHVAWGQECARAVLIFFYGLMMLRLSGKRTFARWSAIDIVISIIVGSSLSRALTGSAPLPGTLAAVAVLVALHVALAWLVAHSEILSSWIEGDSAILSQNGRLDDRARKRHMISLRDLDEALREHGVDGRKALDETRKLELEPSGKISVIKRS